MAQTRHRAAPIRKVDGELSVTSRVLIASAVGVAAATVAALATTKVGRRVAQSTKKVLVPLIVEERGTLLAAVEQSIGAIGLINLLPESLRHNLVQGLFGKAVPAKGAPSMRARKARAIRAPGLNGRKKSHRRSQGRAESSAEKSRLET